MRPAPIVAPSFPFVLSALSALLLLACTDQFASTNDAGDPMSIAVTPSSPPTFASTITAPTAGDGVQSVQLRVEADQKLINSVEAARLGLYGGGIRRRVECSSNTVMNVQPLGSVLVKVAGIWTAKDHSSAINVFDPGGLNLGDTLAADTRYWIYAKISGGAVTFIRSTTAPDSGLRYMSGAGGEDSEYVTTFYTDPDSNVLTYVQEDAEYLYSARRLDAEGSGNFVLQGGIATIQTTKALGASVPSGSKRVRLTCRLTGVSSAGRADIFNSSPATAAIQPVLQLYAPNGDSVTGECNIAAHTSNFDYKVSVATVSLNVWVAGFRY